MIEIDHRHLESETLDTLLMEIVLREGGTDYGVVEVSVEDKKKQLLDLLSLGQAAIVYHVLSKLSPSHYENHYLHRAL